MAHPETFGDVGYAAAVFGVSQSVENSSFEVTDFDRFLFGDPVFGVPEKVPGLQKKKRNWVPCSVCLGIRLVLDVKMTKLLS
jgi:hypothetical protein